MRVLVFLQLMASVVTAAGAADRAPLFRTNDVVAFLGGANTLGIAASGHLETLMAVSHPELGLRFRNLAWEADTVFERPREVNWPSLPQLLKKYGITVAILDFGQAEALRGTNHLDEFARQYQSLLDSVATATPRIALVIPNRFEATPPPLPDLTRHNHDLSAYSGAIRAIAERRGLPTIDLFDDHPGAPRLTSDGWHLNPIGQAQSAIRFVRSLGIPVSGKATLRQDGSFEDQAMENIRTTVVAKNDLWFRYWRPANWAFLGGDRTEQPSSRDHRDPRIRWFPQEMEQYPPLIAEEERKIQALAAKSASSAVR
jgi:hypothetical protein